MCMVCAAESSVEPSTSTTRSGRLLHAPGIVAGPQSERRIHRAGSGWACASSPLGPVSGMAAVNDGADEAPGAEKGAKKKPPKIEQARLRSRMRRLERRSLETGG